MTNGNKAKEQGNASLALVIMGAAVLLGVLTQTQGLVSDRLKASNVKKASLEGQESGLYALTVAKQLVNSNATNLPAVGFKNPADPNSLQDIALRLLVANPNPPFVRLANDGTLQVTAPDVVKITNEQMNQIFEQKDFNINQQKVDVAVRAFSWDPFPSGYGVQTIYFEARANIAQGNVNSVLITKAKIPVPPPPGTCEITATANGQILLPGSSVPSGTSVSVNMACKGVVLTASLFDMGALLASAGPVTAANNYTSNIPAVLPQTTISIDGNHVLQAEARLVDGTIFPVTDFTFTISAPAAADPLICRNQCTCTNWGNPTAVDCGGQSPYADPFPYHVGALPAPLPTLSADPNTSPAERVKLTDWATAYGMYTPGAHWQGAAFPNYPNLLICAKVGQGFDLYAFDPANNCAKTFASARGALGCLREGSLVRVDPLRQVPIESLRAGDRVWNPLRQAYQTITEVVAGPEHKALLILELESSRLAVTDTHPMKTPQGYVQAKQLKTGDRLLWNGHWLPLTRISTETRDAGETVWNLKFEASDDPDENAFEAEGIMVGDLGMQKAMERKASRRE